MNSDEDPTAHVQNNGQHFYTNLKVGFFRMEMSHKSRKCVILLALLRIIYWCYLLLGLKTEKCFFCEETYIGKTLDMQW